MQTALVPAADWIIVAPVLLPLIAAVLLLMLQGRGLPPRAVAAVLVLLVAAADLALLLRVSAGTPLAMTMGGWLPPFGISFTADTMGAAFALAAAVVNLAVLAYGRASPSPLPAGWAFHALVLLLLAGVDGALLTGDLFNLYVWFEVMLIAAWGLLAASGTPLALDGALKYGLLNLLATSLFLAALGLLYGALGTLNMADIAQRAAGGQHPALIAIAALLFVAFATKAAAVPLNAWLPASYHAPPAAVSALLGAILTKVGVYALLRTFVLLLPADRDILEPLIAGVAAVGLILAPLGALAEHSLRRAIGYFLIGGIGASLAGLALPTSSGISGAVAYAIHSMLSIGALYLVAGLIEAVSGQSDARLMSGRLAAGTPLSTLFLVLLVAIAGVPPFLGFWPKLLLLEGSAEAGAPTSPLALGLAVCLLLNALLTLLAGIRLWIRIFWRNAATEATLAPGQPAGATRAGVGAAVSIVALVMVMGLWPEPLLATARAAAAGLLSPAAYVRAVGVEAAP